MTIFGESRLGRVGYVIVCLVMLSFDFVKAPIEHSIVAMHDQVANDLRKPHPVQVEETEAGKINGKTMPFMFKGHENAIRSIVNSPVKLTREETMKRLQEAIEKTPLTFVPNRPIAPEIKQLAAARLNLELLFPVAVIVMTGITIVGLLWMVSARLRDIGWPQFYMWILLAPIFLPKFISLPMPPMLIDGIGWLFYAVLIALALFPGQGSGSGSAPLPGLRVAVPERKASGQFGKLGTR